MFSKDGKTKDVATPRICDVVWHDGEFIKWNDARVHVMSHVLHYGSSVFEGIRCYSTETWLGDFSSARTHAASFELGKDLPHGAPVESRSTLRGVS